MIPHQAPAEGWAPKSKPARVKASKCCYLLAEVSGTITSFLQKMRDKWLIICGTLNYLGGNPGSIGPLGDISLDGVDFDMIHMIYPSTLPKPSSHALSYHQLTFVITLHPISSNLKNFTSYAITCLFCHLRWCLWRGYFDHCVEQYIVPKNQTKILILFQLWYFCYK